MKRKVWGLLTKIGYTPSKGARSHVTEARRFPERGMRFIHEGGLCSRRALFIASRQCCDCLHEGASSSFLVQHPFSSQTDCFRLSETRKESCDNLLLLHSCPHCWDMIPKLLRATFWAVHAPFVTRPTEVFLTYDHLKPGAAARLFVWKSVVALFGASSIVQTSRRLPIVGNPSRKWY